MTLIVLSSLIACMIHLQDHDQTYPYPVVLAPVHFRVEGKLAIILKQPSFAKFMTGEQLILIQNLRRRHITSLKGLEGLVSIDTPEAALEFVRLSTSPVTFNLFQPWGSRLIEPSVLGRPFESYCGFKARCVNWLQGANGMCTASDFKDLGFEHPNVTSKGDAFEVTRSLIEVRYSDGLKTRFVRLTVRETVSQDGHVGRLELVRSESAGYWPIVSAEYPRQGCLVNFK